MLSLIILTLTFRQWPMNCSPPIVTYTTSTISRAVKQWIRNVTLSTSRAWLCSGYTITNKLILTYAFIVVNFINTICVSTAWVGNAFVHLYLKSYHEIINLQYLTCTVDTISRVSSKTIALERSSNVGAFGISMAVVLQVVIVTFVNILIIIKLKQISMIIINTCTLSTILETIADISYFTGARVWSNSIITFCEVNTIMIWASHITFVNI